jgi:hypothetical protein
MAKFRVVVELEMPEGTVPNDAMTWMAAALSIVEMYSCSDPEVRTGRKPAPPHIYKPRVVTAGWSEQQQPPDGG